MHRGQQGVILIALIVLCFATMLKDVWGRRIHLNQEDEELEHKLKILNKPYATRFSDKGTYNGGNYNVVDFGAVGDGQTDDSKKFLSAWDATCNDSDSPTLIIPSGKTFLLGPTTFHGPCKSPIHVQINGNLVAPNSRWTGADRWIAFQHIDDLKIDGTGSVDGGGSIWWSCRHRGRCSNVPNMFSALNCNNYKLSGIRFKNPPGKHVTVYDSTGVTITGISTNAPETSPNTDGLHIEKCKQVSISNSKIAGGDDCIGIGGGTSDVNITNIKCGPGHGISIGSLGQHNAHDEVEHVHVSFCQFTKTQNGARIKTWQGGSGFVKGVTFENLIFTSVDRPININQYYPSSNRQNKSAAVEISGVRFSNLKGTTSKDLGISIACSESVPCTGIELEDVNIRSDSPGKKLTPYCLSVGGMESGNTVSPPLSCYH